MVDFFRSYSGVFSSGMYMISSFLLITIDFRPTLEIIRFILIKFFLVPIVVMKIHNYRSHSKLTIKLKLSL